MLSTSPPVRVGIVGCGSFGRNAYGRNLHQCPDAEVVALCDADRGRAEALLQELSGGGGSKGPSVYAGYEDMLRKESLDAVMIATMADVRPRVAVAALEAGAHVLAAKPMAPSLAAAEHMLRVADQAGRLLVVGYNFRFREGAQAVRRFIVEGGLGKPLFARAWSHEASVPVWGPHYVKSVSGGGSLASTAVHVIDLAIWFLGCPRLISA